MEIIRVFYDGHDDGTYEEFSFATSSWYHKPPILSAIASCLEHELKHQVYFVYSSKYGCRQFCPAKSDAYPVHDFIKQIYKKDLDWYTFEFNDASALHPKLL